MEAAHQAYGGSESDYRPERWKGFREDYGFTGKESDVEVGLQYFGKRYYAPLLNRWVSADPLAVHGLGADLNAYAYVTGRALRSVDPLGLGETATQWALSKLGFGRIARSSAAPVVNLVAGTWAADAAGTVTRAFVKQGPKEGMKAAGKVVAGSVAYVVAGHQLDVLEGSVAVGRIVSGKGNVDQNLEALGSAITRQTVGAVGALGGAAIAQRGVAPRPTELPTVAELESIGASALKRITGIAAETYKAEWVGESGRLRVASEKGSLTARFNAESGDLHIDMVSATTKKVGVGTALYREALALAAERGDVKSVSGYMAMDNARALRQAGGDIGATPRAHILDKLGFTQHTYDPKTQMAVSTRPEGSK